MATTKKIEKKVIIKDDTWKILKKYFEDYPDEIRLCVDEDQSLYFNRAIAEGVLKKTGKAFLEVTKKEVREKEITDKPKKDELKKG